MSGKVDYNRLINIINLAPGFTLGEYDGILSMDDSYVNDFKSTVILFCIENEQDNTAVIDEIVTTANYDSVTNVIKGLKNGDISDVNDAQCNKFANEFVQEVNRKIKNKKWYHQIVMMQCAIINAIHTIFKECGELLTSVDSRIILGLATSFKHWFENSRIQDSDFYKIKADDSSDIAANIANNVDSFLESKLHLGSNYKIFSVPTDLQQIFTCFKKYYNSDINKWIENYESQVDNCTKNLSHKKDVGNIKTALKIIANNVSKNTKLDDKLIKDLSKTLGKVFNVGDIYLIKKEVESSVDFVTKKRDQEKSKSSDNEKKPHSVELEKDKSNTKISATRKLDEQKAEYIGQPESHDDHVAMSEENNKRFKEFLKSFEKNYMNTNDYNWVDTCTQGLGNANDIEMLKAQLTNLIKAITRNDWIAASSAMIIGPLSKTLSKIFRVNDDSNDDVKSEINAVIKKQKLLQNFLKALEKSFYPFNANAWWNNLGESTLFNTSLESPLLDFMQCVTGEIDDINITKKTEELSDALCKAFAVNNTGSITTRLNEIVQRVKDMQKSLKEKYGTDIVDNLLKVIDFVAAQGYNPNSESLLKSVINQLCTFLETKEKQQIALDVIYGLFNIIINEDGSFDIPEVKHAVEKFLVPGGVISADEKDRALEKITSKMQKLRNKRKKKSLTTEQNDSAPQPQIVENNTAQVQQETSSPATDPQQLASQTSNFEKLQKFLDKLEISCMPFYANFWLDDLNTSTLFSKNLQKPLLDFMQCVTGEIDDANINKKAEELSDALCKDFAVNDTGSITTRLNEIIQRVKDMQKSLKEKYGTDIIDSLLKVVDELGDSVVLKHVNGCNNKSCFLCNRLIRIKNHMDTDPLEAENLIHDIDASPLFKKAISKTSSKDAEAAKVKEELTKWKEKIKNDFIIKTANFKKEGSKVKRFAKRAVSKQERKKHTEQKNKNAKVLLDAVIKQLPDNIDKLKKLDQNKLKNIFPNEGLDKMTESISFSIKESGNFSAKEIEEIAKQIRKKIKEDQSAKSDSILALAVLYKVLTAAIDFKKPEENKDQIEKLFKAFAKWFNKYVSPRSAIRSPEVVKALNNTIGAIADNKNAFKCGKLIRAKNAIKKIAKKG